VKRKGEDDHDIPDWPLCERDGFISNFFLEVLRDMYERIAIRGKESTKLPVKYGAFGKVLQRRTRTVVC